MNQSPVLTPSLSLCCCCFFLFFLFSESAINQTSRSRTEMPNVELLFLYNVLLALVSARTLFSLKSTSRLRTRLGRLFRLLSAAHDERQKQPPPLVTTSGSTDRSELRGEDLGLILSRIGLGGGDDDDDDSMREGCCGPVKHEELCDLFAEEEPSLAEVKAAFAAFDEGGDGFIDELELQGALAKLGMAEGFDLDSCRRMIEVHDRNGDGRIDFSEFVRFMEISLC